MLLSAEQYFEQRRKTIDRYVQGEHEWFGDVTCATPSLSCYNPHAVPWYMHDDHDHDHDGGHSRHVQHHAVSIHDAVVSSSHVQCAGTN